jgi:hypothetical protein
VNSLYNQPNGRHDFRIWKCAISRYNQPDRYYVPLFCVSANITHTHTHSDLTTLWSCGNVHSFSNVKHTSRFLFVLRWNMGLTVPATHFGLRSAYHFSCSTYAHSLGGTRSSDSTVAPLYSPWHVEWCFVTKCEFGHIVRSFLGPQMIAAVAQVGRVPKNTLSWAHVGKGGGNQNYAALCKSWLVSLVYLMEINK